MTLCKVCASFRLRLKITLPCDEESCSTSKISLISSRLCLEQSDKSAKMIRLTCLHEGRSSWRNPFQTEVLFSSSPQLSIPINAEGSVALIKASSPTLSFKFDQSV